ncbi:MAG: hypothetical protein WCD64_19865, partial [Pseudolabrys sp.]
LRSCTRIARITSPSVIVALSPSNGADRHVGLWALRVGSLRRTDSVAIEGIADIGEALLPVGATRMTRSGPRQPDLL